MLWNAKNVVKEKLFEFRKEYYKQCVCVFLEYNERKIIMSIDLEKKAERIGVILAKKGIKKAPVMRVGVALDISGSMYSIIRSGLLQTAFNQMMGVSVKFDDNGELDVFKFDTRCDYVGTSRPVTGDYDKFISNNNITDRGGTSYAPIVDSAIKFFFQEKKSSGFLGFGKKSEPEDNTPVLMLILTDGEPNDASTTAKVMENCKDKPIYFHMVGIGGGRESFPTIAKLADDLPNVGEVYLPRIDMSDDEIYEQLICDELIEWIANFSMPVSVR